jgi:SAM-dependent methyltransferase
MEDRILSTLFAVGHKDTVKQTTTLQFKKDLINILLGNVFEGDILEVGCGAGNTTAILCAVAEKLNKKVYAFEMDATNVFMAEKLCVSFGFNNFIFVKKDVYTEEWNIEDIGCVFIDCVHTEENFAKDLLNAEKASAKDPIIVAHDYGLVTKDGNGIKGFLDKNKERYEIIRFLGEKDNWNLLGSGKVVDWEGIQIKIKSRSGNNEF